jgi:drug/metabolite transporter (DMT)-like permease
VSSSRANSRGMLALAAGMAAFAVNDALLKLAAQSYPLGQVIVVRGVFTILLVGTVAASLGHLRVLARAVKDRALLGRTCLDAVAVIMFTSALVHMPLANLSAINLTTPLIITAMAVVLYQEPVGWRRWTAIAVGFAGTLFVVKPTPATIDVWALVALVSAFASASRDLATRLVSPTIPTIVISFMAAIAATCVGLMLGLFEQWRPMAPRDIGIVAMAGVGLAIGNFLIVMAFRGVDISAVAPFRYTFLLWGGLAGYIAFGEIPDRFALIGAALIVGSGLYALHRERVRRRTITAPMTPED